MYAAHKAHDIRSWPAMGWMVFASSALCFLQLFWGYKIVTILYKQYFDPKNAVDRLKEN